MQRKTVRDVFNDVYYDGIEKGLTPEAAEWYADLAMQQQVEMTLEAADYQRDRRDEAGA